MATATKSKGKGKVKGAKTAGTPKNPKPTKDEISTTEEVTVRGLGSAQEHAEAIGEMRDNEQSYEDIAAELGISKGSVMLGALIAKVTPKEKVKWKDDDDLSAAIVDLRDNEQLSWGIISARTLVPESRCRKLYTDHTGNTTKGNRIGRGGRFPAGMEPTSNGSGSKAKGSTKKAAKADPNPGRKNLGDMTQEEITARLEGKTITIGRGAKTEKVGVKSVQNLDDGDLTFTEAKGGKTRTIAVKNIVKASR